MAQDFDLLERAITNTGRTATGIALIFFYTLFLATVFFGFAAYVARVDISRDLKADSVSLDTLLLRVDAERLFDRELAILHKDHADILDHIATLENEYDNLESKVFSFDDSVTTAFAPIGSIVNENAAHISDVSVARINSIIVTNDAHAAEKLTDFFKAWSLFSFKNDVDDDKKKDINISIRNNFVVLTDIRQDIESWKITRSTKSAELKQRNSHLQNSISKISDINIKRQKLKLDDLSTEHKARIASFEKSLSFVSHYLLRLPTIILTLLVTVAAGGLGATVSLTRTFIADKTSIAAAPLFGGVAEGVAAAVGIFFLAGAGMLMLSQGTAQGNGKVELSPYMVAFVAFVSGFMAKDAFLRIQEAGKNIFQAPDQQPSKSGKSGGKKQA